MRALTSAVLFFILNLIGLGLGPLIVGALSDQFLSAGFKTPLGTAMLICGVIGALWACLHYVLAARTIREDIARLER
jgi:MFS family permease